MTASAYIILRVPVMHNGERLDVLTLRPPTAAEMVTTRLLIATHGTADTVTDFVARLISNHAGIPESVVDEMAADDGGRAWQAIAALYREAEKERPRDQ